MKLLLIETDDRFAARIQADLERRGVAVDLRADGREAFDAARRQRPDAIVLAVELGDKITGGYGWCQKFKKDDELRNVPLVLVSAQASRDTFDQHRKLKSRADEYLLKPFGAPDLLESLANHVVLPPGALEAAGVESVGLDGLEAEPLAGPEDLERLDEAFDLLTSPGPAAAIAAEEELPLVEAEEIPVDAGEALPVETAEADLPLVEAELEVPFEASPSGGAWSDAPAVEVEELRAQLASVEARLGELERELAEKSAEVEAARSTFGSRDRDWFQLRNEAVRKDKEILRLRDDLNRSEREALELREAQNGIEQRLSDAEAELAQRDALARTALSRADAAAAALRRAEGTLAALRVEANRVPGLVEELERTAAERETLAAEGEAARNEAAELRLRLEGLEADLAAERDGAGRLAAERESALAEAGAAREENERLAARIAELEAAAARSEERVLKAYQKIQGDERGREKARKALAAAAAALDEADGTPAPEAAGA